MTTPTGRTALLAALGLLLVAITLPRAFLIKLEDLLLHGEITYFEEGFGDDARYTEHVMWFRGVAEDDETVTLYPPFVYRPLVPALASLLPFPARTSINILNILALLCGLVALFHTQKHLGVSDPYSLLGCALYVVSFPVLHYGAIGFVDGTLIGFLCVGAWAIITWRPVVIAVVILLGPLLKETTILLLPVLAAEMCSRQHVRKHLPYFLLLVAGFFAVYLLIRLTAPVDGSFVWLPSFDQFYRNIARGRFFISYPLSFGLPAILLIWLLIRGDAASRRLLVTRGLSLTTGLVFALLLAGFALFAAVADGRFVWTTYPFVIPLVTMLLEEAGCR